MRSMRWPWRRSGSGAGSKGRAGGGKAHAASAANTIAARHVLEWQVGCTTRAIVEARPPAGTAAARYALEMLRRTLSFVVTWIAATLPMPSALAQDDLRDSVERHDGKVIAGRVLEPWAAGELIVLQGGRRVRVPLRDVATIERVGDRVRAFCERRLQHQGSVRAQSFLIDWAKSNGLPGLATAQAMWVVLHDDEQTAAHEFLGHKQSSKGWLWPHEGRWLTRPQLESVLGDKPLRLVGERFAVTIKGGLAIGVDALLDLEHMGVVFYDRFGQDLGLRETLAPVELLVHRNEGTFPKWGFRALPYFVPPPHGDRGHTFYAGPQPTRPERLFFVGAHGLLHRAIIGDVNRANDRDRTCPWLEIGLSMWFEHQMQGPAGFAAPGEPQQLDLQALSAMGRSYRLTHLLQLPMYESFYLTDDAGTHVNWSAAAMLVRWLLADNDPPTRARFLAFVRDALGEKRAASSSSFDKRLGRTIEQLEAPWFEWLARQAGY
jgi:hypothetical protein